jgi:RimJ/RimL family protein N-acetyltransferase
MRADDLRLLHEWLQRPHVREWWSRHETYDDVVQHYLPAVEGREPTDLYFLLRDDEPVGFFQTYAVASYPEYASLIGADAGAAGVDVFVGEERLLGRGIGSAALRLFVEEIVFADAATTHAIADPDVRNVASVRAFEKAGFRVVRELVDPEDGQTHVLVRRDR